MTANVITYRSRMAGRENGKVLGFDRKRWIKFQPPLPPGNIAMHMTRSIIVFTKRAWICIILAFGNILSCANGAGFTSPSGQHSGGMVICQGRLDSVVPLELRHAGPRGGAMGQRRCADLGIIKVDLLGLGMMAALGIRSR